MDAQSVFRTALKGFGVFLVGTLIAGAQVLRFTVFSVLTVFAPIVRFLLTLGSVAFFLTCGFYALVAPGSAFPQGIVLGIATGFAVLLMLYEVVLALLRP